MFKRSSSFQPAFVASFRALDTSDTTERRPERKTKLTNPRLKPLWFDIYDTIAGSTDGGVSHATSAVGDRAALNK